MRKEIRCLSLVIPVCNEETNIPELYRRLIGVQNKLSLPLEIIFVNDGSKDNSLKVMKELAFANKKVKVADLSRNFGHQVAISAGLHFVSGDAAVIMDADLQDPPELIENFVSSYSEGYEAVYAVRKTRKEGVVLRSFYFLFYRLFKVMSKIDIPLDAGDFCLIDRKIVDILVSMDESRPFLRGLRSWVGFKQIGVEYDRQARYSGKPKYTFLKLIKLALDGIFSFSDIPLRVAAFFGFTISVISILLIGNLIIKRLPLPGTTLIAILVLFLGGVQLITIGILGEYIGRIYEETKKRPLFIIKEKINI